MASGAQFPTDSDDQCQFHTEVGNTLIFVCESCKGQLACKKCIVSKDAHQGHILLGLDEIIPEKKKILENYIKHVEEKTFEDINLRLRSLTTNLEQNEKHFGHMKADIRKHGECLKNQIDNLTVNFCAKCDEMLSESNKILQRSQEELQSVYKELIIRVNMCKRTLDRGSMAKTYEVANGLSSTTELPQITIPDVVTFSPEVPFDKKQLEAVFGKFSITNDNGNRVDISSSLKTQEQKIHGACGTSPQEIFSQVSVDFNSISRIHTMAGSDNTDIHVLVKNSREVTIMKPDGQTKKTIPVGRELLDISISPETDRLWMCDGHDILEMTGMFIQSATIRFTPDDPPSCLFVGAKDRVAVGSTGSISVYNRTGQKLHLAVNVSPRRVAVCPRTNRIGVIDSYHRTGQQRPQIIVMTSDLTQTLYIYQGHQNVQSAQKAAALLPELDPRDICFDHEGRLIVADYQSASILLLGTKGELLRALHVDLFGPTSLLLHKGRYLWVHFDDMNVKMVKYDSKK